PNRGNGAQLHGGERSDWVDPWRREHGCIRAPARTFLLLRRIRKRIPEPGSVSGSGSGGLAAAVSGNRKSQPSASRVGMADRHWRPFDRDERALSEDSRQASAVEPSRSHHRAAVLGLVVGSHGTAAGCAAHRGHEDHLRSCGIAQADWHLAWGKCAEREWKAVAGHCRNWLLAA